MKPWLRTHNLLLGYRRTPVSPFPMNIEFNEPGITALLGRNGAGKSSLLKAIVGEAAALSGTIEIEGTSSKLFKGLAYVPQEPIFPGHLKMEDALGLAFVGRIGVFGRLSASQIDEIEQTMVQLGLAHLKGRILSHLSPGERQRAFLARALLQNPTVLLLDEPTNHLDPEARFFFWAALEGVMTQTRCKVLVSTHDLEFARRRANSICAFKEGRVVANSKAREFWNIENIAEVYGEGPARHFIGVL